MSCKKISVLLVRKMISVLLEIIVTVFCHGPSTCGPRTCLSSAECVPGEHCAAIGLCIEQHSCGGRTGGDIRDHVFGPCGSGDTCVQGRCSSLFVCTASAGDDASIPPDGSRADANVADAGDGRTHARYGCDCHCSVGAAPRRGPAAWLMAALSLASLGWIKRRSAVRRSQSPGTVSGWLRRE